MVIVSGCMDENAFDYDPTANTQLYDDDNNVMCIYDIWGCTDENALDYLANATTQLYEEYENSTNIMCQYENCAMSPGDGCLYADHFRPFHEYFDDSECKPEGEVCGPQGTKVCICT